MSKIGKHIVFIMILILFTGCSYYVKPNPSTFEIDQIREFSSNNTVNLVNIQTSIKSELASTSVKR